VMNELCCQSHTCTKQGRIGCLPLSLSRTQLEVTAYADVPYGSEPSDALRSIECKLNRAVACIGLVLCYLCWNSLFWLHYRLISESDKTSGLSDVQMLGISGM
jgi:hypothetical protein